MKQLLLLLILTTILLSTTVSAVCTLTLSKEVYAPTEAATVTATCDSAAEKSQSYNITWYNHSSGEILETDLGTTPSTVGENFFETYTIPTEYTDYIDVNMTGTSLEGEDSANVTGASASSLTISNETVGGKFLGLTTSITAVIKDVNNKKVTGGQCFMSVWSNDLTTMVQHVEEKMYDGEVKGSFVMGYESFTEATDYQIKIKCYCGSDGSENECVDEDGTAVENTVGSSSPSFTTNTWVTINENPLPIVYENGTDYPDAKVSAGFNEAIYFRANISNYGDNPLEIENLPLLINNDTGEIFGERTFNIFAFNVGNQTNTIKFFIDEDVPTGVYYITNFFNIYNDNILVSQGIVNSDTFNVTGTDDLFIIDNVDTDKAEYYTGESLHVCANITNKYTQRVEFDILYNYRCGETGSNDDLDRSLLGEHRELRAVSPGISQYQCAQFPIPFADHLMYMDTQCYASVTIQSRFITTWDNKVSKTSGRFNVTDFGLFPEYELDAKYPIIRLYPDWRYFDKVIDSKDRSYIRAKINISEIKESTLDPNNNIDDDDWDVYALWDSDLPCVDALYNYTVLDINGDKVDNELEAKSLQWVSDKDGKERQYCALGIEEVNLSDVNDDYFEVRLWFESYNERQTEALENISLKTGTFHFSIDCPTTVDLYTDMECIIQAQVEDPQVVQKEVDFTCYIGNNHQRINFNQMVTTSRISIPKTFYISELFDSRSTQQITCEAGYYNFGSRIDTFSDTFNIANVIEDTREGTTVDVPSNITDEQQPEQTMDEPKLLNFIEKVTDTVKQAVKDTTENVIDFVKDLKENPTQTLKDTATKLKQTSTGTIALITVGGFLMITLYNNSYKLKRNFILAKRRKDRK